MGRGSIGNPLQTEASDADIKAAAQGGPKKNHFRTAQKVVGKLVAFKDRAALKFHAAHPAVTRGRDAAVLNSVIVTALALALLLVVALPAAYCLSRFHFKGCKVLNTLFMAGLFINVNYIVVPIFLMLRDGDVWLKSHFGSGFLLNNLVVLAVVYAATALPFTIYLLSGYFATLPHDFEEAAYIDGASYFSTMTRIIFPMAKPSIITIILFNFLSFWNEYIISMTLMSSTKAPRTLPVGLLNLMQAQQSAAQYGTMYAGLVLVMLPTLILYICVQRQLTQGMTVGGLKG